MMDSHPGDDHMDNMERKEPTHLQESKPSRRENQRKHNLHDKRNGADPQLPEWERTTRRSGL
jgi:hypothetical protein